MSSHLNRADTAAPSDAACGSGPSIGYNAQGQIVVLCGQYPGAVMIQEFLVWFLLTSAIFVLVRAGLRARRWW